MSHRKMNVNRVNQGRLPRGGRQQEEWDLDCLRKKKE